MPFDWGVVARCTVSDDTKLITQSVPQSGFELGTSVRSDCGRGPETSHPPAEESIYNRFGPDVNYWYGFGPTCETVDTGQQILKPAEYGKGPTMSACMWSNRSVGSANVPKTGLL